MLAALAEEVDARRGDRVRAVHQDTALTFRLALEGRGGRSDLVLSVEPALPLAFLTAPGPAPGAPTPLANALRAELKRARLLGAEVVPGERAMCIRFERAGTEHRLWVECFGREANLYLVDANGLVTLTPRGNVAERRGASVGTPFEPVPAAPERVEAAELPEGRTASAVLEALRTEATSDQELSTARGAVLRIVKRGLDAAERRITRLTSDLEKGAEADRWQERGELLRGSFHLLRPGLAHVRVPDYSSDPPREVEIELDPKAAPGDQVGRCFRRARKLRTAAERAVAELPGAEASVERLAAARAALGAVSDRGALEALTETLPEPVRAKARGALRALGQGQTKAKAPKRVPWRTYRSADGWEIRVGKSAADSDALTLRASRPHDLFLHVRSVPGAHVIVPTPRGKTVPKETLLDAAELACLFSKRSEAETNEVDYTERRYVRKPKGLKPGLVLLERSKTLTLRRDDKRRTRLRTGPDGPQRQ